MRPRSSGVQSHSAIQAAMALSDESWVCTAPLGWPVVPDVYQTTAVSLRETAARWSRVGSDGRSISSTVIGAGNATDGDGSCCHESSTMTTSMPGAPEVTGPGEGISLG